MRTIFFSLLVIAVFMPFISCQDQTAGNDDPQSNADISKFTGHWSFDIDGSGVGWLDVRQEDSYLDADLLWRGGSVSPVAHIFLTEEGVLHVTRTSNRRRDTATDDTPRVHTVTSWIEARADGESITGYFMVPRAGGIGIDSSFFQGVKLPDVPPAPDLSALELGEPVELFNGVDLTGWELIGDDRVNGWKAVDGILLNDAMQVPGEPRIRYGNLRTTDEFEDFNLTLEVNVPEGSNSGVYLRGMYEIQILDSYGMEPSSHHMGGLYSRISPLVAAEKPAGEWQSMDITLVDRHVTVVLNNITIIDNQPVYGPTGGAIQSDVFAPGPIFLQGDHGPVSFRNMLLTPIIN